MTMLSSPRPALVASPLPICALAMEMVLLPAVSLMFRLPRDAQGLSGGVAHLQRVIARLHWMRGYW